MEEYLQNVKAWRSQINDVEDQAAKISVEEQSQITSIQSMEIDLESVKSNIKGLKEETESMLNAKNQICTQILDKYKRNAALEAESSKLSQTLELIQQEKVSLSSKLIEKRAYYAKSTEELHAALEVQQAWILNGAITKARDIKLAQREVIGERDTIKDNFSGKIHPITNNLETNESYKFSMTNFNFPKAKFAETRESNSKFFSDCSKMEQSINQLECVSNEFPPELKAMDLNSLEDEHKALLSDKAGETEFLQTLSCQIEHLMIADQSHMASIQSMETDLESVMSKIEGLKEETESMLNAKNQICTQIKDKYKKNASLEAESSNRSQFGGTLFNQGTDEEGLSSNVHDPRNNRDDFAHEKEIKKYAAGHANKHTLHRLMSKSQYIRNVSVIGHIGQGKTFITRLMLNNDIREEESILSESSTFKSRAGYLVYGRGEGDKEDYLITIIDTPRNPEHVSDVTTALRLTDGALLVVDVTEGVLPQTENALRNCLNDLVKPILVLNRIDCLFLESNLTGEEVYTCLSNIIDEVNRLIEVYKHPLLPDAEVNPIKCSVVFCADGWAFTLETFVKFYKSKVEVSAEKLWGEKYFDSRKKRWTSINTGSSTCKRGFVQFCFEPIKKLRSSVNYKESVKCTMKSWLPAKKLLLDMIVNHLPSPADAQQYRVQSLYEGPRDNMFIMGIRDCNPEGPLIMFVTNLISTGRPNFVGYGRVFSGTIRKDIMVKVMGPNYTGYPTDDISVRWVKDTNLLLGDELVAVESAPCGNIVALVGVDDAIVKSATITNWDSYAIAMRPMIFPVSPLIQLVVECKYPHDRGKLASALVILQKSDPIVRVCKSESGQCVIHGVGEQHLAYCLKILGQTFKGEGELLVSTPRVVLRETIAVESEILLKHICGSHSMHIILRPIREDLMRAIDSGMLGPHDNIRLRAGLLTELYGWDKELANKIRSFGPTILLSSYTDKNMEDPVVAAFQLACQKGALGIEMRGISIEISGEKNHRISHKDVGSVKMAVLKGIHSAEMSGKPVLLERVYTIQVKVPHQDCHSVRNVLRHRSATNINNDFETPVSTINACLPVVECVKLCNELRSATKGKAFVECNLAEKWAKILSDPLEPRSRASVLLADARKNSCMES